MEQDMRQRLLFDYISKLNDRNISRKQASGFTLYATVGLFTYLASKSLENIPLLNASEHTRTLLLFTFTVILDCLFSLFVFFVDLVPDLRLEKRARISSTLDEIHNPLLHIFILSYLAVIATVNYYAAQLSAKFTVPTFSFYFYFGLCCLLILLITIHLLKVRSNRHKGIINVDMSTLNSERKYPLISLIITTILLAPSFIPIYYVLPRITTSSHVAVVTWSFQILLLMILILVFIRRHSENVRAKFTISLERMIAIDDLPPSQILGIFSKEYLGEDVTKWIAGNIETSKLLQAKFNDMLDEQRNELEEVRNIDKNLTYEIRGRAKKLCHKKSNVFSEYTDHLDETSKQLQKICAETESTEENEYIKSVTDEFLHKKEMAKNESEELCRLCASSVSPSRSPCKLD